MLNKKTYSDQALARAHMPRLKLPTNFPINTPFPDSNLKSAEHQDTPLPDSCPKSAKH
jgi:hypothetical protein